MGGEWPLVPVRDIAAPDRNAIVGGPFGSKLGRADYVVRGVPVIRGQNMGGRWVSGEFVCVSADKAESLRANLAGPGDIVFTQRGTLGQVSMVPLGEHPSYLVSQSQMKLTVDPRKADPLFYYYVFRSEDQQRHVRVSAIQTGVPHTNLGILRDTPVVLPPLPTQRAIAHILGTLDDKIELNRRQNETLEAIARALFKSWFVDFDPVHSQPAAHPPPLPPSLTPLFPSRLIDSELGPIPEGWRVAALDSIADFQNGLALQRFAPREDEEPLPVIKIRELRTGVDASSGLASPSIRPDCIIDDGDVIFSWSGSLMVVIWCGGRGAPNQHLFRVSSTRYPRWLYYFWLLEHLPAFQDIAGDKATTMGHIQRHHLTEAKVIIPPAALVDAATGILEPYLERIVHNNVESRKLAATRDALLPRLLAAELDLDWAQRSGGDM